MAERKDNVCWHEWLRVAKSRYICMFCHALGYSRYDGSTSPIFICGEAR